MADGAVGRGNRDDCLGARWGRWCDPGREVEVWPGLDQPVPLMVGRLSLVLVPPGGSARAREVRAHQALATYVADDWRAPFDLRAWLLADGALRGEPVVARLALEGDGAVAD